MRTIILILLFFAYKNVIAVDISNPEIGDIYIKNNDKYENGIQVSWERKAQELRHNQFKIDDILIEISNGGQYMAVNAYVHLWDKNKYITDYMVVPADNKDLPIYFTNKIKTIKYWLRINPEYLNDSIITFQLCNAERKIIMNYNLKLSNISNK